MRKLSRRTALALGIALSAGATLVPTQASAASSQARAPSLTLEPGDFWTQDGINPDIPARQAILLEGEPTRSLLHSIPNSTILVSCYSFRLGKHTFPYQKGYPYKILIRGEGWVELLELYSWQYVSILGIPGTVNSYWFGQTIHNYVHLPYGLGGRGFSSRHPSEGLKVVLVDAATSSFKVFYAGPENIRKDASPLEVTHNMWEIKL